MRRRGIRAIGSRGSGQSDQYCPTAYCHTADCLTESTHMTRITGLRTLDLRFPTSQSLDGSDAMNPDPDYSAAYVILDTDSGIEGHGLTFTIGRGNDICCAAIEAMRHLVVGLELDWVKRRSRPLLAASHRRQPAALDRSGQGRHAPRHRRGGQRRLGSVGQGGRQAGVAAGRRHEPGRDRRRSSTSAI